MKNSITSINRNTARWLGVRRDTSGKWALGHLGGNRKRDSGHHDVASFIFAGIIINVLSFIMIVREISI